jgi:hypothetical protein
MAVWQHMKRGGAGAWVLVVLAAVILVGGGTAVVIHLARHVVADQAQAERRAARNARPATRPAAPTTRQSQIRSRDAALQSGDLVKAATVNAVLSQEALTRAARVQQAWMTWQDPKSRLFPQDAKSPYWTYENTAADCFGFLLNAGLRLRPSSVPALVEAINAESKLAPPGELCTSVQIQTLKPIEADDIRRIFTSSEYVKDGLLSVYERLGDNPSKERMYQVMDNILAHSTYASKAGPIPAPGSEENGNILQAGSRLSYAGNRPEYAELAARIADAAVMQMLPANDGLPVMGYDYATDMVVVQKVKLRDHGSEITPGLTEIYALAVDHRDDPKWKERADRWAAPIATMFEKMFKYGRNKDGLFVSVIHPVSHRIQIADLNDNWGYLFNGVLLFTQAARMHGQLDAARLDTLDRLVDDVSRKVAGVKDFNWQAGEMDGYADTLESGMYIANHRPSLAPMLVPWVDEQISHLFDFQKSDGFADRGYLDGNFIRTCLMYADLRSGGFTVQPWRPDVMVGFAKDAKGQAVLVVTNKQSYSGVLKADEQRHKTIMKLPWDWPRLNSWPEWFVPTDAMKVVEATGLPATPTIADLQNGLKLALPVNSTVVIRIDAAAASTAP